MKKNFLMVMAMLAALGVSAEVVEIYGDLKPGPNGVPKKWSRPSKSAGTVETVSSGDKNVVILTAQEGSKQGIGIMSSEIAAEAGIRFKLTVQINGGPCEIQLMKYTEDKHFGGTQKIKVPAQKSETEITQVIRVEDSEQGAIGTVRFGFRVYKGATCSISNVRVEQLEDEVK